MVINKKTIVLAITLTFAILCTPLIVSIDSSEGYMIVEGEHDLYFKTDMPLTESQVKKLYNESSREDFAKSVLSGINVSSYNFDISDITINSTDIEKTLASKTSSNTKRVVESSIVSMNISFKVTTTNSSGASIFSTMSDEFFDLAKYMNNNKLDSSGYMYIKANVIIKNSSDITDKYTKNQDSNLVKTHTDAKILSKSIEVKSCSIDFKSGTYSIKGISISSKGIGQMRGSTDYTYEVPTLLITSNTVAYQKINLDYSNICTKYKLCYNDKTVECEINQNEYYDYYLKHYSNTITSTNLITDNIKADKLTYYYNSDGKYIFSNVGDSSLSNEDALEAYLLTIGTLDSSFNKVVKTADAIYGSEPQNDDNTTMIIIITAIVIIISLVLIYILIKRVKKSEPKKVNKPESHTNSAIEKFINEQPKSEPKDSDEHKIQTNDPIEKFINEQPKSESIEESEKKE